MTHYNQLIFIVTFNDYFFFKMNLQNYPEINPSFIFKTKFIYEKEVEISKNLETLLKTDAFINTSTSERIMYHTLILGGNSVVSEYIKVKDHSKKIASLLEETIKWLTSSDT